MAKAPVKTEISVVEIKQGLAEFCILGTTPLLFNRMAEKAKRELLLPAGRKNAAAKAANLKHDPVQEFRNSVHRMDSEDAQALLAMPAPAFKGAMMTAALDSPGASRTAIGRMVWIPGYKIEIFGIPRLHMGVVRSADINKTPDIRTRAILAEWACRVTVRYVQPMLRDQTVANLLATGGITCGIGDGRQEKGKLDFGQFEPVSADNEDWLRITSTMGRAVQQQALDEPQCFDADTEELFTWFEAEVGKRYGKPSPQPLKEAA